MVRVWLTISQDEHNLFTCVASDADGKELTRDRSTGLNGSIGMVVTTLLHRGPVTLVDYHYDPYMKRDV